jgi:hypothetical protein
MSKPRFYRDEQAGCPRIVNIHCSAGRKLLVALSLADLNGRRSGRDEADVLAGIELGRDGPSLTDVGENVGGPRKIERGWSRRGR